MKNIRLAKIKLERIIAMQGMTFGLEVLTENFNELEFDFSSSAPESRNAINCLLRNQLKILARFQHENKTIIFKPGQLIFINIEAWQLEDFDICKDIALVNRFLNEGGVNICLELTEREFDDLKFHIILKNLFYLKERGLKLALDDYVFNEITWRTLLIKCVDCVDFLKIDLTGQVDKDLLVQFISGLVSKPRIIFEKVETKEDLKRIYDYEVDNPLLQGFLFN